MVGPQPEDIAEVVKGAGEVAKLTRDVYNDLAAPAARELGLTAEQIVRTLLKPVRGAFAGIEQLEVWLAAAVRDRFERRRVRGDEVRPPDPQIYAGTVFGLLGSGDVPELREMFATLLASAMVPATADMVHPSFAEIIRQLSIDEARLVDWIAHHGAFPLNVGRHASRTRDHKVLSVSDSFSVGDKTAGMDHPEKLSLYIVNLRRLGIMEITSPTAPPIDEVGPHRAIATSASTTALGTVGTIHFSSFGAAFAGAVVEGADHLFVDSFRRQP